MSEGLDKWLARYRVAPAHSAPCAVLAEHLDLLPRRGRALDLACGAGANGLLLARHGLQTLAWDYAWPAIGRLRATALAQALPLYPAVRDVLRQPPPASAFAVIVVCRFLERGLAPCLERALQPGGRLFYQTFTRAGEEGATGPRNPAFRLAYGELPALFGGLRPLVYREDRRSGEALLVAQRPAGDCGESRKP